MQPIHIPLAKTHRFPELMLRYVNQDPILKTFYNRYPNDDNVALQAHEKLIHYSNKSREVLVNSLAKQYGNLELSSALKTNLKKLSDPKTVTVTTGHQLNLFSGPLYVFYKIIDTLKLCERWQKKHPDYFFVPVFWMASEDHDFEEINHFYFEGKKVQWSQTFGGPVGRMKTHGLDAVLDSFSQAIGQSIHADKLYTLFDECYNNGHSLAQATRLLIHKMFGVYGLVIIDGDDVSLKSLFSPIVKKELVSKTTESAVLKTNNKLINALGENVTLQVHPRPLNLFYITDKIRKRIVHQDDRYQVLDTDISFSKNEILNQVEQHPERFSPNALMRPLYQETVLPNIAYVGGAGELAYWLQLKQCFSDFDQPFPMLVLRSAVLLTTVKQLEKCERLSLPIEDLFLERTQFINKRVRQISNIDIDFSSQKQHLKQQFIALYALASKTDITFLNAVKAQEIKQLKGLEALEKRLLKAQKRKLRDEIIRATDLQQALFPHGKLQERQENFSQFYLEKGEDFIPYLIQKLEPLRFDWTVLPIS